MIKVKIKQLYSDIKLPEYARPGDAGMDLYSAEEIVLNPGERHLFKLGFAMEIPEGTVALVWDRGGMATNHGIHSIAGVIDSNFRGEVCCVLYNTSAEPYAIQKGDKIAQLLIQKVEKVQWVKVDELSESARGDKGWFSSGR